MLDSTSQWNLLADCAKDWGFRAEQEHDVPQNPQKEALKAPVFSLRDIAEEQPEDWTEERTYESFGNEPNKAETFQSAAYGGTGYEALTELKHFSSLTAQEEKALLHELMANPKNATLWQLCLMGYSRENIARFEDTLQSPLEGVEAWLLEGIKKGWLRKLEKQYAVNFLEYPLYIHRLQRDCEGCAGDFSVGLVKIQTSDFVHDLCMQSFEKYLSKEDYLCKINGLGYAVTFGGRKNFSACAVMEKIADMLEQILQREHVDCSFTAGLSEFCQSDTAETLLDRAKQALSLQSPCGIKVKSFVQEKKNAQKNSLVQSDEKRFLFFGVQ